MFIFLQATPNKAGLFEGSFFCQIDPLLPLPSSLRLNTLHN